MTGEAQTKQMVEVSDDEKVRLVTRAKWDYLGTTLPDEIEEFGLDTESIVIAKVHEDSFDGERYKFLKVTEAPPEEDLTPMEDRYTFEIQYRDDSYLVRFPIPATRDQEDSPFHHIPVGTRLFVELNRRDQSIRVYTSDHFAVRNKQLVIEETSPSFKTPLAGLSSWLFGGSDYVDLTAGTPYQGTKFRLVPFDAHHRVFAADEKYRSADYKRPSKELASEVIENGQMPQCQTRKLVVRWDPEAASFGPGENPWKSGLDTFTFDYSSSRSRPLYAESSTKGANVILPAMGSFKILSQSRRGENYTTIGYYSGSHEQEQKCSRCKNWFPAYHECPEGEDHITAYVPV